MGAVDSACTAVVGAAGCAGEVGRGAAAGGGAAGAGAGAQSGRATGAAPSCAGHPPVGTLSGWNPAADACGSAGRGKSASGWRGWDAGAWAGV
nr:hypothetical protein [uncultured Tistrella sp.]